MYKIKYREYLESSQWDDIRKKVIHRAKGKCEGCAASDKLEVHHLTYERVGMELMTDLVAFCSECHSKAHFNSDPSEWNMYLNDMGDKPVEWVDMTKDEQRSYILDLVRPTDI